ncbi:hypothetical protein SprV_0100349800 [Sparganum proliferum]
MSIAYSEYEEGIEDVAKIPKTMLRYHRILSVILEMHGRCSFQPSAPNLAFVINTPPPSLLLKGTVTANDLDLDKAAQFYHSWECEPRLLRPEHPRERRRDKEVMVSTEPQQKKSAAVALADNLPQFLK